MEMINVVELLRGCPQGMELNCTMYKNVEFDRIDENNGLYPIICRTKTTNGSYKIHTFTKYGCYNTEMYSKCVIFPKGKTTWEGFHKPFEPGDIVITDNNEHAFIYSGENDSFWECYCGVYCGTRDVCINSRVWSGKSHNIRLATEEEKEKLFQVIKDNGYKWNAETKTLEKIEPEFKVSDTIRHKILNVTHTITEIKDKYYILDEISFPHGLLPIKAQDEYELVPNKFDVRTLKPFDKVLVRDTDKGCWDIHFYEGYNNENKSYPYRTLGGMIYKQCIPYEGNEHLTGLVKDCSDYYKTW